MNNLGSIKLEDLDSRQIELLKTVTEHPLRFKLFHELRKPMTAGEVAKLLGVRRNSLYYHINVLLEAGLVAEVGTNEVHHLTESVYQSIEETLSFIRANFKPPVPNEPFLQNILDIILSTCEDCQRSFQRGGDIKAQASRIIIKIKPESLGTIPSQITKLVKDFIAQVDELEEKDGDIEYSVTVTHFDM